MAVGGADCFFPLVCNGLQPATVHSVLLRKGFSLVPGNELFVAGECAVTCGIENASIYAYAGNGFLAVTYLRVHAFCALQEPEPNAGSSGNVAAATFREIQPAKCYSIRSIGTL